MSVIKGKDAYPYTRVQPTVTRTFSSVQISLCPVEHGDSFETSHRASWSPGVHHIMQVREYDAFEAAPIEHQ